jgi:hypothetical protein
VPGTSARGTGVLIGPKWVLTAGHVVRKSEAEPGVPYSANDLELRFGKEKGAVRGVKVTRFSSSPDWALLELPDGGERPVADALRAGRPPTGYRVRWETWGYADETEIEGKEYQGTVRTDDPRKFQVSVEDGGPGTPPGLSGSPCICAGEVVGILIRAERETSLETLYVLSVAIIAEGCAELKIAPHVRPYVDEVTFILNRKGCNDLLPKTAATLGLVGSAVEATNTIPAAVLPRRVAFAMMGGPDLAFQGLRSLQRAFNVPDVPSPAPVPVTPDPEASRILRFSACSWIAQGAVETLSRALNDENAIALINTRDSNIASWYVHRAGCLSENDPGRFEYCLPVDVSSIEPDELLHAFEGAVAGLFGHSPEDLPSDLAEHDHANRPIVVWFTSPPKRASLDYVRAKHESYGRIRVILLVGPEIPPAVAADYLDAVRVEPYVGEAQSGTAIENYKKAVEKLTKLYNRRRLG